MYRCYGCCIPSWYKTVPGSTQMTAAWWPGALPLTPPNASSATKNKKQQLLTLDSKKQRTLDDLTGENEDMPFGYQYIHQHNLTLDHLGQAGINFRELTEIGNITDWSELVTLVQPNPEALVTYADLFPLAHIAAAHKSDYAKLRNEMGLDLETLARIPKLTPRLLQSLGLRADDIFKEHPSDPEKAYAVFGNLTTNAHLSPIVWRDKLGLTYKHVRMLGLHEQAWVPKLYKALPPPTVLAHHHHHAKPQ